MIIELTYCEECLENLDHEQFDYRFERPVCHRCVSKHNLRICESCDSNELEPEDGRLCESCRQEYKESESV